MNQLVGFVDMNAYFASVEQQTNPRLRGRPIAVAGRPLTPHQEGSGESRGLPPRSFNLRLERSVVTTASYEARALGVKTAMSTREALAKLPSLIIVPPDYGKYQAYTKRIAELASEFSPTIELCSIDEMSLDLGHLVGPDEGTTVRNLRTFVTTFKAKLAATVGPFVTASIGFASSRTLAKLAADQFKPDGQFLIADTPRLAREAITHGIPSATWVGLRQRLDLTAVPGIGRRLAPTLRLAGYASLDDLAAADQGTLILKFGILGLWLSQIARGGPLGSSSTMLGVNARDKPASNFYSQVAEQSMSHTTTLPRDLPLAQTRATFFVLAERVADRMRRAGVVAHELFVGFGRTAGPSWLIHERYSYPIMNGLELFRRGWHLVEREWRSRSALVRRPHIGVQRLVSARSLPLSILPEERRRAQAQQTIGTLRDQWGSEVIQPATTLTTQIDRVPDGRKVRYERLATQ